MHSQMFSKRTYLMINAALSRSGTVSDSSMNWPETLSCHPLLLKTKLTQNITQYKLFTLKI